MGDVPGALVMMDYQPYVEHLNELVGSLVRDQGTAISTNAEAIKKALDGGAPEALRRLVAIEERRDAGAFFTSSSLADLTWSPLLSTLDRNSIIVDPACGAGSLLIPPFRTLLLNADPWQAAFQIRGRDVVGTFIEAALARLTLAIADSHPIATQPPPGNHLFPGLQEGNSLDQMNLLLEDATHVVLNPPYNPIIAPEDCEWATGKINHAALFTELTVRHMPSGSRLVAILPEVLRSGPRYARWRDVIRQRADIDQVASWGAFDSQTDIDVFRIYITKRSSKRLVKSGSNAPAAHLASEHNKAPSNVEQRLSQYFQISVGAVVPHRHPEIGPVRPFATARQLPVWQTISTLSAHRRFSGRCESPPFVAIRRTSRPGQAPRALATIVGGTGPVAVDNHLIVARPINGSYARCQQLLDILQQPKITEWLDEHYRCHHLPVEAIRLIPWEIGEDADG